MRWLLIIFVGYTSWMAAQDKVFEVNASLDTAHIRLGEPITLSLSVVADTAGSIEWPAFTDRIQAFYVIARLDDQIDQSGERSTTTRSWQITAFDTGFVVLEPIAVGYYQRGAAATDSLFTEPQLVRVDFVPVDTSATFKPIKAPLNVPLTWRDYLPYILGAIALLAIGIGLWWWWKKRKKPAPPVPQSVAPEVSPLEEALASLLALEKEALWQRGNVKEYHVRLTDIVRVYIEKRFHVDALEQTTDEVLYAFRTIPIAREQVGYLQTILQRADLAKFARFEPLPEHNEESLRLARQFVTQTQPADTL